MSEERKVNRFFGNVVGFAVLGLIGLLFIAFFVGLFLLKQWRWSCGG